MIGWLIDRWWLWKNREELRRVDEEMAAVERMRSIMERKMLERYGPDWRTEAGRKFERAKLRRR